jgi:LuxR family maltose regulon positive regulatory protein
MPSPPRLAKLSVPRSASALVRPRLHRLLDEAVERGAAFIAAGPGAGKSTLAVTWAASRAGRMLWFRADAGDADPAEAFGYFRKLAGASKGARALPPYRPRDVDRLDVFAASFFRAFFRVVPAASTLVVDDAHAASGDAFSTLLAAAIREAPPDVAVIALSRREPAGPLLDEVASGRLVVLDGAELAFDAPEAITLLAGRTDAGTARQLQARTDGWAAGMLLLAQSMAGAPMARDAASRRIAAYFNERVLATFEDSALRMLAAVSLLPEVDEASLAQLGLDPTAAQLLERLRRENAFVARLERAPASWRLHDLLRDALQARIRTIGDRAWRRATLLAAAPLAAASGHVRDAVQMYLDADERALAKAIAEQHARGLVRAHRLTELDVLITALPGNDAHDSFVLQLAQGESAWQRNDANEAVARFERANALLEPQTPSPDGLLLASSALNAIFEGWQSYEGTGTWADRLRHHLTARDRVTDPHDVLRVDRTWLQAADQLWDDSLCDRPALFDRVLALVRDPPPGVAVDEIVATSAVLVESSGFNLHDEARFQATVAATAPCLQHPELAPLVKAMWLNSYAALGRHWPSPGVRLPAAGGTPSLELAYSLARSHGGQALAFIAAQFLTHAAIASSDLPLAERWLDRLRESADPRHVVQAVTLLSTEAGVLGLAGEWRRSLAAYDRADALAREHGHPETDYWDRTLGRYRVLIASGDAAGAREGLLRDAPRYPEGLRRDFALILADVAQADVEWKAHGAVPAALLAQILARARAYNWRGIANLLFPLVARICSEALRLGVETDFARTLIRDKQLPAPSPYDSNWPWPVRVHALGGLRILIGERPIVFGARAQRKPLDLLKAIVAHGPAAVDTAIILDALWPEAEGAAARASLDMTLMRLRKLLGRDDALTLDAGRIALDPGCVWVDAYAFARGASEHYPGPLFGNDAVAPWWASARERLHQRFLRRAVDRGRELEADRRFADALVLYEAALAEDSLAEELYQGAIRCHVAEGRHADALRVFRRCREQLSIVLSVRPSPATLALVAGLEAR